MSYLSLAFFVTDQLLTPTPKLLTPVLVVYVEIVHYLYMYGEREGCNNQDLDELGERIDRFKSMAVEVLGEFHKSGLGTEKFHLLSPLVEDMRMTGLMGFCSAGPYEYSHVAFKSAYRSTSKISSEAMEVCVDRVQERLAIEKWART